MKFLIIRFSSIGDIVLTTPVIRCLKKQLPDAQIHFLTKKNFKAVTEHNPYIDRFFYFENDLEAIIEELKKEGYDYIIDLHKNFRSYRIRRELKCKSLAYRKLSVQKFLLTKLGINLMPSRHIVMRNLDAVLPLGVKPDTQGLDYFISKADEVPVDDLPTSHYFGYIGIVIGASFKTKKLPIDKLQELCRLIEHPIVLLGGKEEVEEGNLIASVDPIKIYNACGKFTLNQSAYLVKKAKLIISHDTGLQYIASAYKKPTLAIWGGTSPKLAVEPWYGVASNAEGTLYKNFVVEGLSCQPCSNFGTTECPKKHFKCMKLQDIAAIAATAQNWAKEIRS